MSDASPNQPAQGPAAPAEVRIRSSAWVFAAQVAKTALSIPVGIVLARTLGASGKGAVSVVQTVAAVTVAVLNLGMPNAVMWLAAKGKASARGALALGAAFTAGAVAVVGGLALVFGAATAATRIGLSSPLLLGFAMAAIVPSMVGYFTDSYLIGRGVVRATVTSDVAGLAFQLSTLLVLALSGVLTVQLAVAVWLVGTTGSVLYKGILALRVGAGAPARVRPIVREGGAYALKAWLGSTVNMLSLRQDVLILAAVRGTREVGIYTVGVAAAELAWYIPNALQGISLVKFAAEKDSVELASRLNRSVWPFTAAFGLVILVVLGPLIPLVYGAPFRASILPLALLLPGIVATAMASSLSAWLSGQGHPGDPAVANVANMLVNLAANFALAPHLGAAGAALASTLSYSVGAIVIMWRFKKRSHASLLNALVPRRSDLLAMAGIMRGVVLDRFRRGTDSSR